MEYFPLFFDLNAKPILIITGKAHATEEKVLQMLNTGAHLRVVGDNHFDFLDELAAQGKIEYIKRAFQVSDLDNVFLVISAKRDREFADWILAESRKRHIFCNVVDVVPACDFIYPAIVNRGKVTVAISTSGASPALAIKLKREIAEMVGEEYGELADLLAKIRPRVLREIPVWKTRSELFKRLINLDLLGMIKRGYKKEAERIAERFVERSIKRAQQQGQLVQ